MTHSGVAELPLHEGHVPLFLLERMKKLGGLIARYIVEQYGAEELLSRLSDPVWFQAFNNVIGMDWDSSGSTTVVLYVLKNVFPPSMLRDNGIAVLGGKGIDSRMVPDEARLVSNVVDESRVVRVSRLSAKIDSVALQDGYSLYIHGVLVESNGEILVIQQGMNPDTRTARRYHLLVPKTMVPTTRSNPHSGVASITISPSLNLVDSESAEARRAIVEIASSTPTGSLVRDVGYVNRVIKGESSILSWSASQGRREREEPVVKSLSRDCPIYYRPVTNIKLVEKIAEDIKKEGVREFDELLSMPGVGAETIRALALVADLIYGYKPSLRDPTTVIMDPFLYAYAHGGKDGVPYPVRVKEVDKTIEFFTSILSEVRAENREKEYMLRRLALFVNRFKARYVPR